MLSSMFICRYKHILIKISTILYIIIEIFFSEQDITDLL